MGIDPIWRKQPAWPLAANHAGQFRAIFDGGLERAIRQAEVLAPVDAEDRSGGGRFTLANFGRAVRCRFSAREIEDADTATLLFELQDSTGHAELGIVRMWRDDEDVEHGSVESWGLLLR